MEIYLFWFWRLGTLRSGYQHARLLARTLFQVAEGECILTRQREERALQNPFDKDTNSTQIPHKRGPNHLLTAPPPKTVTLEVRISTYAFQGDTNIRSIAYNHFGKCLVLFVELNINRNSTLWFKPQRSYCLSTIKSRKNLETT